ncbi:MAG: hypothetical protein GXP04_10150 [Alphaproteobacteria bacterium]|nr:hypothetical protein [Alphaproteobacteria bacterium]
MNPKKIVAVTTDCDLHVDVVLKKIQESGGSVFRVNLNEFPQRYELSTQHSTNGWSGQIRNLTTDEFLQLEEIGAFWIRKKGDFSYNATLSKQELAFANDEMEHLLFGLFNSCDCYWMSRPSAIRSSMWKLEQLHRAMRFGFATPKTLTTSSSTAVRQFRSTCKNGIIFKTLSSASLASELVSEEEIVAYGLKTTLITDENDHMLDSISIAPGFFQEYIPKSIELRVTVVGQTVYAAEIHSQSDPRTSTDYRDFSAEIKYDVAILPDKIERLCIEFVRSYGLEYGALDLIVTPAGEYVFLENNPVGQFYFVEQLVPALTISDAMASLLIQEAHKQSQ